MTRITRRSLIALGTAALAQARNILSTRLGIMCQLTASEEVSRKTLAAARLAGFRRIQVNFPWNRVDSGYLKALPSWIRSEDLQCDVLSAYVNCLHPETVLMATRREDFAAAIHYAADVGAHRLVAWTGSFLPDLMKLDQRNFAPGAKDAIVSFLEPWLQKLERAKLTLALETYITLACPDAPSLRKLLDRLPPFVGAVLDPPNLTPPSRYEQRDTVLAEMCATLENRIAVVHMKDFRLNASGGYDLPGPLMGEMNYALFLQQVGSIPAGVPVIAEHLEPSQFAEARRRLLAL